VYFGMLERANHPMISLAIPTNPLAMAAPATAIPAARATWGDMPCVATNVVYRTDIPLTQDFIQGVVEGLKWSE
jgi:hypothetical protein